MHPKYICDLFHYSIKTLGPGATYTDLAETMNLKSAVPGENRTTLNLSRWHLVTWFHTKGGSELSSKEKPLLKPHMKVDRLAWCLQWQEKLTDLQEPMAMLDEKWFYKRNRR